MDQPRFRRDLYRGTATYYDRFRLGYPRLLLDDLVERARVTPQSRMLDLACGTGQVAFGLASRVAEVWAVDLEKEMVIFARERARERGVRNVRWIAQRAENLGVGAARYDLVTIGNAFHRLDRERVAKRCFNALLPDGHLAVLWSDPPWHGDAPWQATMTECIERWKARANTADRIPRGLDEWLAAASNQSIMTRAGFEVVGTVRLVVPHEWTLYSLTGFLWSTSFLSQRALGHHVFAFEEDFRETMLAVAPSGKFHQDVTYGYELATRRGDEA